MILVGLPWDHEFLKAKFDDAFLLTIKSGLEKTEKIMGEAGYDYKMCYIGPGQITTLVELLKTQSWDGVVVGFGIRGIPEMTIFFEEIVNTVRTHAPSTKLLFNSTPETIIDAARRVDNY